MNTIVYRSIRQNTYPRNDYQKRVSEWVSECCISINIYNLFSTASSDWSSIVQPANELIRTKWMECSKVQLDHFSHSEFPMYRRKSIKWWAPPRRWRGGKRKNSVRQRSETHTIAVQSPLGCTAPPFDHGQTNDGRSIVRYIYQLWIYSKMIGHYLINSIRRLSYLICIPDILRVSGKCIGYYRYYLLGIKAFQTIKWTYNKQLLTFWTA